MSQPRRGRGSPCRPKDQASVVALARRGRGSPCRPKDQASVVAQRLRVPVGERMDGVHVIVVDDNDDDAVLIMRRLTRAGLVASHARADNTAGLAAALADRTPDVVI